MLTSGFKVGEFNPDDARDEIDIRARFEPEYRTITGINNLKVQTKNGLVPVSSFISVSQSNSERVLFEEMADTIMRFMLLHGWDFSK